MTGDEENVGPELDAAMTALYRKLDEQLPEGEPDYDVNEGLGKVLNRLKDQGKEPAERQEDTGTAAGSSSGTLPGTGASPASATPRRRTALACPNCAHPIQEDGLFCLECGARTPATPVPPAPAPGWPQVPPVRAPGWPQPPMTGLASEPRVGLPGSNALGKLTSDALGIGPTLDPLRNRRFLHEVARRLAVCATPGIVAIIIAAIVAALVGGSWPVTFASLFAAGGVLLSGLGFLLVPVTALLRQWSQLVPGKGAARPIIFEHVAYALRRSSIPLDSLGIRRLGLPGGVSRDYLELHRGRFTGYVSCFEYGNDLYLGWTYWMRMSPASLLLTLFKRLRSNGPGGDVFLTLLYEPQQAMVASMHACILEGVDVAAGVIEAEGRGSLATLPIATATSIRGSG
jgi:hypothetical protein